MGGKEFPQVSNWSSLFKVVFSSDRFHCSSLRPAKNISFSRVKIASIPRLPATTYGHVWEGVFGGQTSRPCPGHRAHVHGRVLKQGTRILKAVQIRVSLLNHEFIELLRQERGRAGTKLVLAE